MKTKESRIASKLNHVHPKKIFMKALSNDEVTIYLSKNLTKWALEDTAIKRDFKFKLFVDAFSFMAAIALEAEKMDHHPTWCNVFNQVSISLNTHSANGITQLDFDLAKKIDKICENYKLQEINS